MWKCASKCVYSLSCNAWTPKHHLVNACMTTENVDSKCTTMWSRKWWFCLCSCLFCPSHCNFWLITKSIALGVLLCVLVQIKSWHFTTCFAGLFACYPSILMCALSQGSSLFSLVSQPHCLNKTSLFWLMVYLCWPSSPGSSHQIRSDSRVSWGNAASPDWPLSVLISSAVWAKGYSCSRPISQVSILSISLHSKTSSCGSITVQYTYRMDNLVTERVDAQAFSSRLQGGCVIAFKLLFSQPPVSRDKGLAKDSRQRPPVARK